MPGLAARSAALSGADVGGLAADVGGLAADVGALAAEVDGVAFVWAYAGRPKASSAASNEPCSATRVICRLAHAGGRADRIHRPGRPGNPCPCRSCLG